MSGIWKSGPRDVPVWPGMPAGSASPSTYYAAPAIGGNQGIFSGSDIVGVARAIPFILDRPRRVQSIGVYTAGAAAVAPGDDWEFGIYNDIGDSLLWSGTLSGAGLNTFIRYSLTVEIDLPQRFIVTLGLITSNGASYYGKNLGGATCPGWCGGIPVTGNGGAPIQGPTGFPVDLSAFTTNNVNGVGIWKNPIYPTVRVYS